MKFSIPHPNVILLLSISAMHLIWGIGLVISDTLPLVTGLNHIFLLTNDAGISALLLMAVAVVAIFGLAVTPQRSMYRLVVLVPQQIFLVLSMTSVMQAVVSGMYPDGVVRPHMFILMDQTPMILLVIGYTLGIINDSRR